MNSIGRRIALSALFLLILSSSLSQGQESGRTDRSMQILEQFDIHNDGDALLIPVTLDGKVYPFIFDTGVPYIVYDKTLRSHLGPAVNVVNVVTQNGATQAELFDAPNATAGKLSLKTQASVVCSDLKMLRESAGYDVFGLVGMAFLKDHVIDVDFDRGKLTFLKTAVPHGDSMTLSYQTGIPTVALTIPGLGSRKFRIDTGSSDYMSGILCHEDFNLFVDRGLIKAIGTPNDFSLTRTGQGKVGISVGCCFRNLNTRIFL